MEDLRAVEDPGLDKVEGSEAPETLQSVPSSLWLAEEV